MQTLVIVLVIAADIMLSVYILRKAAETIRRRNAIKRRLDATISGH